MDVQAALARFPLDPILAAGIASVLERQLDQAHDQVRCEAARLAAEVSRRDTELHAARIKIEALTLELAQLRRLRYGVRSEALSAEQRELFEETLATDLGATEAELAGAAPSKARAARERAGRQPLPAHLPRIEQRHEPDSCTCGHCGSALIQIGEDITEQLDVEPARFFVRRHIRPQYACRACETVTAAPVPAALIDGGMAAPGLYVWLLIGKFLDHLPLYRLEGIARREGVVLSRTTLAEWVGRIGVALQPLAERLAERLRQGQVLHADETPVRELDPGAGKTRRGYLWAYRSNALERAPPIVVFDYQSSRAGSHAQAFLRHWRGALMVDDFAGYKALFGTGIVELGCLAHARRKFFELDAAQPNAIAGEALARIAELYAIEAQARDLTIAARAALRAAQAQPKLAALRDWLLAMRATVADGSGTARAIDYSLKRWPALSRYATAGHLPIDNNPVENDIRPIALGKKNWLFVGSERAGKRAAAIQSLLYTAKLNGLDPAAWLRQTLERLPTCPYSQIDSLLPLRTSPLHD
jgi:transposase